MTLRKFLETLRFEIGDFIAGLKVVPATVFVVLSATHGTLNLSTSVAGGVTASEVTGNGSAAVIVQSSLAKINATLAGPDGLIFTPATGFAGAATGAAGAGG